MGYCWGSSSLLDTFSFCHTTDDCSNESLPTQSLKTFSFKDLRTATNNFRPVNLTTSSFGIGSIYKGWIDEQAPSPSKPQSRRMVVTIKWLNVEGFPGHDEWLAKLNTLGQLHHPNLVEMIGYCLEDEYRFIVSEFFPKGNLENQFFNCNVGTPPLSWETRMKVAVGVAKGLSYLHDTKSQVIFRYLDASNIMLDDDFNAKLSTYVSTQVTDIQSYATQGYAAPEFVNTGSISAKSDVYSYGILLLVLLTGRPALKHTMMGEDAVVDWIKAFRKKLLQMMDPRLKGQYPKKAAFTVATLALQCTLLQASSRPEMSEVLQKLKKAVRPLKCI